MRLPAVDWIKAAAIVAVAVTHGVPNVLAEGPLYWPSLVVAVTDFHVPTFLMAAGFLAGAERPLGVRQVAARLSRILPPYLVAVAFTWSIGWVQFRTPRNLVFKLVTGAALGPYYFVPVLAGCFLLLPLLSRARVMGLVTAGAILAVVAEAMWLEPARRLSPILFWQIRDPLLQFHFGNFLLGILAARHRDAILRALERSGAAIALGAGIGVAVLVSAATRDPFWLLQPLVRTVYAVLVAALIAAAVSQSRPAPRLVRFLSETTLTVYLYHLFAYPALKPVVAPLPLGLRATVLAAAGLAAGSLVALAGRRLFGRYSRDVIGS